jgi:uncharacterized protein YbjT (DUF2867 family)
MKQMEKVLIAGATGYLGKYISQELTNQHYYTKVLVRNPKKFKNFGISVNEIIQAQITDKSSLEGVCKNVNVVISSVGITRQKDGLTYMDVDYQANLNLLEEAKKSGVKKFIYVSVLNGDKLREVKICAAKEKFVDELKKSGLEYCIIRPNGFFSDMAEFYNMAKSGRAYLFGKGNLKYNPIHGKDLAEVCVKSIESKNTEINVGGPEVLTQNEIAITAFDAINKTPKITHIPDWIRRTILKIARIVLNEKTFGPIEFFMTVMAIEMVAPKYGKHTLKEYFQELNYSQELLKR